MSSGMAFPESTRLDTVLTFPLSFGLGTGHTLLFTSKPGILMCKMLLTLSPHLREADGPMLLRLFVCHTGIGRWLLHLVRALFLLSSGTRLSPLPRHLVNRQSKTLSIRTLSTRLAMTWAASRITPGQLLSGALWMVVPQARGATTTCSPQSWTRTASLSVTEYTTFSWPPLNLSK